MKNLRRILVLVSVILLIACSVGIVAAAQDEYKGSVAGIESRYAKVEKEETNIGKSQKLEEVYTYLRDYPVNPESTGYEGAIGKVDGAAVTIANALIAEANSATELDVKVSAISRLVPHTLNCVPTVVSAEWEQVLVDTESSNVALVSFWLNQIKNITKADDARKQTAKLYLHLDAYPINEQANKELLDECSKKAYDISGELYHEIETFNVEAQEYGETKKLNKIRLLNSYLEVVDISAGGAGADEMISNVADLMKWGEDMLYNKRVELDKQANFDSYDWTSYHLVRHFDGNLTEEELAQKDPEYQSTYKTRTTPLTSFNATPTYYSEIAYEPNGNGYQALIYGPPTINGDGTKAGTHLYVEPQLYENPKAHGLVIELDMWLSENFHSFSFESREPSTVGSKVVNLFKIRGIEGTGDVPRDKPITIKTEKNANTQVPLDEYVSVTGAIERECWFHLTFTFDPVTRKGKLYLNYDYLFEIAYNAVWEFQGIRMNQNIWDQEVRLDNIEFYQGTEPRIYDKFRLMALDEQFQYYVEYMNDEANKSLSRNNAYKKAEQLLNTYKEDYLNNPELSANRDRYQQYVDAFTACDYNAIRSDAMKENIKILSGYVGELATLAEKMDSSNLEALNNSIAKIDAFVKENSELINRGDTSEGGYQDQMAIVANVKKGIVKIDNAKVFVAAMEKFERATTYSTMLKRAEAAKIIYDLFEYSELPDDDPIRKDPIITAFEEKINKGVPAGEKISIFEYYDNMEKTMLARLIYENTKKIIECNNIITSLEGYESTVGFWRENAEFITPYATVVRDIVNPGLYDASVEGVDAAVEEFRKLDVYFYKQLQKEHIAAIKTQLEKYNQTDKYIEKVAICTALLSYIDPEGDNDLAINNTYLTPEVAYAIKDEMKELNDLKVAVMVYNEELALRYEDYNDVLASNTARFLSIITRMNTVVTYEELKPLLDEAKKYYYGINLENEEIVAAAETYDKYRIMIGDWEENGTVFVGLVNELKEAEKLTGIEREDAIYSIIAKCSLCVDRVDITMEGVDVAMKAYTRILGEYVAETNATNAIIENTDTVAFASNVKYIATSIISILVGIIKN